MSMNDNVISVGLCEARHEMPVSEFVFGNSIDPTDFAGMSKTCMKWLEANCGIHVAYQGIALNALDESPIYTSDVHVNLYVTGLTAACAAFIQACAYNGVGLSLMHYDRESGDYIEQYMF